MDGPGTALAVFGGPRPPGLNGNSRDLGDRNMKRLDALGHYHIQFQGLLTTTTLEPLAVYLFVFWTDWRPRFPQP